MSESSFDAIYGDKIELTNIGKPKNNLKRDLISKDRMTWRMHIGSLRW